MTRINLVLALSVVASAMYLVSVQYESRRLFIALDKLRAQERSLGIEHESLQGEKHAMATPSRVEKIAREKLHMQQNTPAITQYVNYSAPAYPLGVGAAPAAPSAQSAPPARSAP